MTIENRLKRIILEKYGSMREFSKQIGMSQSTFATIMNRGIHKASINNVIKICQALEISADELANDKIVPINGEVQKIIKKTEINELLAYTQENIDQLRCFTVDGKQMNNAEIELFLDGFNLTIGLIRKRREREANAK